LSQTWFEIKEHYVLAPAKLKQLKILNSHVSKFRLATFITCTKTIVKYYMDVIFTCQKISVIENKTLTFVCKFRLSI